MLGSSRNWVSAGADLAQDFHVFALDLRNHGRSPPADQMSYEAMAADVIAWLDEHGIGSATILGHSMGGKVAMVLACRHPGRASRLIVADIAPRDYAWPEHRQSFAAMNELPLAELQLRGDAERRFEAWIPDLGLRKFLATNLEQDAAGKWRWQINLPVLTAALPELERNSLSGSDRFDGPVLFVAGGRSNYVGASDQDVIRAHFPAATIAVIAESGHNPHMETRASFVAKVRAFAAG